MAIGKIEEEAEPFLSDSTPLAHRREHSCQTNQKNAVLRWLLNPVPWILSTLLLGFILLLFITPLLDLHGLVKDDSYEKGFRTEAVLHKNIPLKLLRWNGNPSFNENKQAVMPAVNQSLSWPDNRLYVGMPSPQIDQNWKDLIGDRYFSLSKEEAIRAWGTQADEYSNHRHGGWTAGLEVFHLLHCVNRVRKALHPEYYPLPIGGPGHIDHCIEVLREGIQCWGPTTLVPARYDASLGHHYANSDQLHTCRDVTVAREFSTLRQKGGKLYHPYPDANT